MYSADLSWMPFAGYRHQQSSPYLSYSHFFHQKWFFSRSLSMVMDFRNFIWWINPYSKNILVMSQFCSPSQCSPWFYRIWAYQRSVIITKINQAIHFPSRTICWNFWVFRHAWQTFELFWNVIECTSSQAVNIAYVKQDDSYYSTSLLECTLVPVFPAIPLREKWLKQKCQPFWCEIMLYCYHFFQEPIFPFTERIV